MSRTDRRKERIREKIDIFQLLEDLGYDTVRPDMDRDQQFPCDLHGDGLDGTPSAKVYYESQSWYCVSVIDPVLTTQGWVPLGAQEKSQVPTLDGTGVFSTPLMYQNKGVRSCLRLKTKAGYEVTLTPDHEIEVVGKGWIPAGDVVVGDEVRIPKPKTLLFNSRRALPISVVDLNQRKYKGQPCLNLPDVWSQELGEALGYVFGEGWVTPRLGKNSGMVGITSSAEDADDAREIFNHLQVWAGGRGGVCHRTGSVHVYDKQYIEDQYVFTIGDDGFCEWFCRLGLDKKDPPAQRRLPGILWNAPQEAIRGFLRGMYATDGSLFRPKNRKGIRANLYSVSSGFLRDVQLLLLQFGIHSRLHPPAKTQKNGVWYLQIATGKDILAFREYIGVANRRKQQLLDSFQYNPRGSRPFRALVASVEEAGMLRVADITMPGDPTFVAGGIKVHNCFGCGQSRDQIETVRAKKGLGFMEAIQWLEQQYKLPSMPWESGDEKPHDFRQELAQTLKKDRTFEQDQATMNKLLTSLTVGRDLPCHIMTALWEAYDKVVYLTTNEKGRALTGYQGRLALAKLRLRTREKLQEHADES